MLVLPPPMLPVLGLILCISPIHAFTANVLSSAISMAKVKPLSTANYLPNQIPRLEPGLRIKSDLIADLQKLVFFTPIDWLRFLPEPVVIQAVASSEAADLTPKIQNNNPPFSLAKLRALVESLRESASNRFATYMKKVVTATLIVASSLSNPAYVRKIAKPLATAGLVAMAGTPLAATAGVLRKYTKLSPTQKLATTPLFYLANSNGQPFLQEDVQAGNPDQRIIVYFMSSEDATDYLEEMAQASGGNSNEFRVMTTSMEKVVNKIQSKKQSRKLGRFSTATVLRIQPSTRQCENAEKVVGGGNAKKAAEKLAKVSIPMFSAKGLAIKRSTGEVVTPFYFSYEDLKEDWAKLSSSQATSSAPSKLVAQVSDFTEVMLLSNGVSKMSLENIDSSAVVSSDSSTLSESQLQAALVNPAIVPPKREIEMLRRYYRNGMNLKNENAQARIMGAPR